ncbi:hypothetical protein HKX42_09495 [Salinisphaera sp. USBA-960]|nr:hypothetical protein [Salifodinibacter halophilus]
MATALLACVLVLAGCASKPSSVSYFRLHAPSGISSTALDTSAPTLVIAPVAVADYLDHDGLVYQPDAYRVVIANDNRWASPLPGQLTTTLKRNLEAAMPNTRVAQAGSGTASAATLRVKVDSFVGNHNGNAHIAGRWRLVGPAGQVLKTQTFARDTPLASDGYRALVESLSRGWQQVGQAIVSRITPVLHSADDRAGSNGT